MKLMRKLKIALATLAPFLGGAEVAAERLACGLQEAGYEVLLIVGKQGVVMERMEQAGLRCIFAPLCFTDKWSWWRYYQARKNLQKLLAIEQPDVVHSNDLPSHQIVSDAACRLGVPRICHHRFPFDGSAVDWFNKYGAERHLFVSKALMEEMCANSARLAASDRSVIPDGLPLQRLPDEQERQRTRRALGLSVQKTIVIFAGQVIERKGIADLLRAWSLMDASLRRQAELIIAGDDLQGKGQYRLVMQQLADELQCDAKFVGFQKNVADWLAASDIAVVPSHVEPLGNATLEAMSFALPVIGCAVGGIPEMIMHEQTGLLVSPHAPKQLAAAITCLLSDRDRRLHYGKKARQRCEELFSLETHVQSVLQEYSEVLSQ